jgi:hypothetical protein
MNHFGDYTVSSNRDEPSKAEMLAALVAGTADESYSTVSIQRSHRFPLLLFIQIENLAKQANVPVSVIINELIECGLEALREELPEDMAVGINRVSKAQANRPTISDRFDSKKYRARAKRKKD